MSQFNVGKASIDLVAENADLKKKLQESQADLDKFKKKADDAGEEGASAFEGITKSASNLRETLSKVAIPAALAAGIVELIKSIDEAQAATERLRASLAAQAADYSQQIAAVGRAQADSIESQFKALQDSLRDRLQQLGDAELEKLNALKERSAGRTLWDIVVGAPDEGDISASFTAATNAAIQAAEQAEKRLEERRKEQAAKEKADAERKAAEDAKRIDEQAQREQDARDREYAAAVDDEMRHREWLREQAEQTHQDELRRIEERGEAQMEWLRRVADEQARIRREQENGFGVGNVTFGNGGAAAGMTIFERARMGRGNGRY